MGASKKKKKKLRKNKRRQEQLRKQGGGVVPSDGRKMLSVTYPDGTKAKVPDDGRVYPKGTMISWDKIGRNGRPEMAWCVTGGGWPFDD